MFGEQGPTFLLSLKSCFFLLVSNEVTKIDWKSVRINHNHLKLSSMGEMH